MLENYCCLALKLIVLLFTLESFPLVFIQFSNFHRCSSDVTNNQVQVITTSQNLSTQDEYITYP
jgi:cobalt-zinc-cadmium resistance protein CzcA